MLERELKIQVFNNTYLIKFPNVGQMLDIEARKMAITSGQYKNLMETRTVASEIALINADVIATFSILCPKMGSDLNIDFFEMEISQSKELVKVYRETYMPWYNKWLVELSKDDEVSKNENNKTI
jgi:hypothetical protein